MQVPLYFVYLRVQSFCLLVFTMAKMSLYGYQQGMASSFAMRLYRFYIHPRQLRGSSGWLWTVNNLLVHQFGKVEIAQQSCRHHASPTMFYTCQLYITKYFSVLQSASLHVTINLWKVSCFRGIWGSYSIKGCVRLLLKPFLINLWCMKPFARFQPIFVVWRYWCIY